MASIRLSSSTQDLKLEDIHAMLTKAYWCPGISQEEILKGIKNSALTVGAYTEEGKQIGFLRVISDKVNFACLYEAIVHQNFRYQGIGRSMVNYALGHPELKDVKRWLLITEEAHGVYAKCGFRLLPDPEKWMSLERNAP